MYQQDLEEKVDRSEFVSRITDNSNVQDSIVKLEYNFKGILKKLSENEDATNKSYRKTKKMVDLKMEETKTNFLTIEKVVKRLEAEIKSKPGVAWVLS